MENVTFTLKMEATLSIEKSVYFCHISHKKMAFTAIGTSIITIQHTSTSGMI
jgi:hypothetical protein